MKKPKYYALLLPLLLAACADNSLEVSVKDDSFPFQIILDTDEGGDVPDAEDYDVEIKFADFVGNLPDQSFTLHYEIETEDDFTGIVEIDKVTYEVEIDDCTYERELSFDPVAKIITWENDPDLEGLPESIEVTLTLPGADDTEGSFVFRLTDIEGSQSIVVGEPHEFEYEVVDADVAGDWELTLESEEDFVTLQSVLGTLNDDLKQLSFADITGKVKISFDYNEITFEIELNEEESVCEDGETETAYVTIEIEAEYEAEDGELEMEGSHFLLGDDGEIEDELDFIVSANYSIDEIAETITISFQRIIDEDNFEEGDELFVGSTSFTFEKD